eukprot:jgi/Orpsp1_1/1186835/evm.model.d7180000053572.1
MLELRTAALLRKKDQREQDYFEICEKFAIIISDIQEILKLLKIISSKGYFEDLEYKIIVRDGNALGTKIIETDKSISKIKFNLLNFIKINNDDKKDLKVIINELNDILDDQKNQIKNIYSNNPNTRMIHGRQLTYIYNFARNKSFENKYDELYEENNVSLHKIIKKANLLKENKRGIYSHSCRLEDIEINTVYCSLELTGEFPLAQTVLYCNEETSEDEIISFIYKSIKCDQNTLFIFIKPESLSREKKSLLIELLKELYSENPKQMVSCLLFIYSEGNKMDEFIMEIQKLPHHIYFDFKNNNNYKNSNYNYSNSNNYNNLIFNTSLIYKNNSFKKFSDIKIYSSEISGLGKSSRIKNDFKVECPGYNYVYFPICDNLSKNEIIKRLLKLSGKKIALHLDLSNMNNIEIASEFLFSFLILKYYSQSENIFYYGNEMRIKVELPNDFIDYKKIFLIFNFFENIHLTCDAIPPGI